MEELKNLYPQNRLKDIKLLSIEFEPHLKEMKEKENMAMIVEGSTFENMMNIDFTKNSKENHRFEKKTRFFNLGNL